MKIDFNKLNWPAVTLILVIVAFTVWGGYKLYTSIKAALNKNKEEEEQAKLEAEATQEGGKPTYSLLQYKQWADQLYSAMAKLGTDTDVITTIFDKQQNLTDILQLIKAFGTRNYGGWTGESGVIGDLLGSEKGLTSWLDEELSKSEKQKINTSLATKGINFSI